LYGAALLTTPGDDFIKYINKMKFSFICNKRDKIKRNNRVGNKLKGGIQNPIQGN
jgi:hypothetical protein